MVDSLKKMDYHRLSSYKPLFLDYVNDYQRLSPFFAADPGRDESWRSVADRVAAHPRDRHRVAEVLARSNRSLGADADALEALDALGRGALAVVTGQQVGLFGGPLYTLYKALTAVETARRASSRLGKPVVALFWMDDDDHDFEEIRHARVIDRDHELVELSYAPADPGDRVPVAAHRIEEGIEPLLARLEEALPASEFREEVMASLRECYVPGRSMPAAFGSWLLRMTRGTGLAVVDPALRELKSLAGPLFEREAAERSESSRLVNETTERLLSAGYHAQASTTADRLNLFFAAPGRFHILSENGMFSTAADGRRLTLEEIRHLIRDEPERFSPNVILRPLFQDAILPTLAYVAGPNELAYFAQLGGVYRHFGVPMPIIAPRASFTIVEKSQARFLERYRVNLPDLRANDESLLNSILKEQAPPQLEEDLSRARKCIQEITNSLERDLSAVDPTLGPTVQSTRGKLLHLVEELESKSLRAIKKKDDTLRRQFFSTRTALFPAFEMQERVLCPVQYLSRYGWFFPEMVTRSIDDAPPAHVLLYV